MLLKFAIQDFIEDRKLNLREETLKATSRRSTSSTNTASDGRSKNEDITLNYLDPSLLGTGSRVGEVINMKWEDID